MKTPKSTETQSITTPTTTAQDVNAIVEVAQPVKTTAEVAVETAQRILAHRLVRDKSPGAVASKVAQRLNREKHAPPAGLPYWTGPDVLAQGWLPQG